MTTRTSLKRRRALLSLLGLATQTEAFALSPKVPDLSFYVRLSQFVVVARVERFIFRGALRGPAPLEFDKDFEDEGNSGNRAMDVVLQVEKVLFKKSLADKAPAVVRINWSIAKEERTNVIGSRRIVFLREENNYRREDGGTMKMHTKVMTPLPMEHEKRSLEAISKITHR